MTEIERKEMLFSADMIQGAVNRICVTNDIKELKRMVRSAQLKLEKIATMRYVELGGETNGKDDI